MKTAFQVGLIGFLLVFFAIIGRAWYFSTGILQPEISECSQEHYVYCGTPRELGLRYRNAVMETVDHITISGWYIPGQKGYPGIVMVPGIGDTKQIAMRYVPSLHAKGFNLLLIDLRNSGKSGGFFNSMGLHEKQDVHAAINYLLYNRKLVSAGVFGFSSGAGVSIMAMAENKNIKAGVFESGNANFETLTRDKLFEQYGWQASLLFPITKSLFELRAQVDIESLNPQQMISKISPRPVFIIHGDADPEVAFAQGKSLFVAAKKPKRFWPVFKSGHLQAWQADKQRAEKEIPRFFNQYL